MTVTTPIPAYTPGFVAPMTCVAILYALVWSPYYASCILYGLSISCFFSLYFDYRILPDLTYFSNFYTTNVLRDSKPDIDGLNQRIEDLEEGEEGEEDEEQAEMDIDPDGNFDVNLETFIAVIVWTIVWKSQLHISFSAAGTSKQ